MLYRRLRRRRLFLNFYFRPMPRSKKIALFILAILLLASALLAVASARIRPVLVKLAEAKVTDVFQEIIYEIIAQEMSKGTFDYSKIVRLEKNDAGEITALVTNMAVINAVQAEISKTMVELVENDAITDLDIPLGNVIGGVIFSGRGPKFTVKVFSAANVNTQLKNDFSAVGINQTRHRIILEVTVDLDISIPGEKMDTLTVGSDVVICETVIVGRVPNVYASIGESA